MINNIFWFRTDLRLSDNKGLAIATEKGTTLCIYILDTSILTNAKYNKRLAFFYHSLSELKENINKIGGSLLILKGDPQRLLPEIFETTKAQSLYFNEDYTPFAQKRDKNIIDILKKKHIEVKTYKDYVIFEGNEILKSDNSPYKVFTPYKGEWLNKLKYNLDQIKEYKVIENNLYKKENLESFQNIELKESEFSNELKRYSQYLVKKILPGENQAKLRWSFFYNNLIIDYSRKREELANREQADLSGTSAMSAYYKFGLISIRQVVRDCVKLIGSDFNDFRFIKQQENKLGIESYLSELIWREFYKMIIYNFPDSINHSFQSKYEKLEWNTNEEQFIAWCRGETGFPIVDAAMIQLNTIGWMHNRCRMIVASFLCKDLHINWKLGERYFYEHLIDYDQAANVGGWQWVAGTGTDAAPYFRIYNPTEQGLQHDPSGEYVKRYIPQLSKIPLKYIHNPSLLKQIELEYLGVHLGVNYPSPIIDHKIERIKALDMYKNI